MRVYGRVLNSDGDLVWQEVQTDSQGFNDYVYVTAFAQACRLNLGESPFYSNYGVPAKTSVIQQISPDYYIAMLQQQYAGYFANLTISRVPNSATPTYTANITLHSGIKVQFPIGIPT